MERFEVLASRLRMPGAILYLPCPILFTDFCFSLINFPWSTASSSKK